MERYLVEIYKKTIMNEYVLWKTEKFNDGEKAIDYAKKEAEKGYKVKVDKVTTIIVYN